MVSEATRERWRLKREAKARAEAEKPVAEMEALEALPHVEATIVAPTPSKAARAASAGRDAAIRASEALLRQNAPAAPSPMSKQERFDELLSLSIEEAIEFMRKPIPDMIEEVDEEGEVRMVPNKQYARQWGIKASLISSVFNTATKIDENELRRQKNDGWDELMKQVDRVQAQRALGHGPSVDQAMSPDSDPVSR